MKTYKYIIKDESNKVFDIISYLIKKKLFKKKFNLSGIINDKEFILHLASEINYSSNIYYGPYVKLKLIFDRLNKKETKLTLYRINGLSYIIGFWGLIFCIIVSFLVFIYQITINDQNKMKYLIIALICIVWLLILETIAKVTFYILVKRIEKIIKLSGIEYKIIG